MGYKQSPGLIVIVAALLLLTVATPLAYGQLQVNITGRMCCTSNGNCIPGASVPVQGVAMNVSCMTPVGMVGWGVTPEEADRARENGILLNITINIEEEPGFDTPMCVVTANLPTNSTNCPILNRANGMLVGMALPVNPIPTSPTVVSNLTVNLDVPFFIKTNATIGIPN